jgi:hypothetical protein
MSGAMVETAAGVDFPVADDGRRSTSAFGRAVIADALRGTDAPGALGAEQETNWRSGYLTHFRRVIEAGLPSRQAALAIAADGAGSLRGRMRAALPGGDEGELDELLTMAASRSLGTATITGAGAAEEELALPYRGERLRGGDLARRLEAWVGAGIIEPSCADAVRAVADHPDWLSLPGRTVAVLGAGSEIGPLPVLLRWGATVAGIDLPEPRIWERVLQAARSGAGTLLVPVTVTPGLGGEAGHTPPGQLTADVTADSAGADLTSEVPEVADWLAGLRGPVVLGNYVYADGAANVRVCAAADTLTLRLQAARDDVALAFLATPTARALRRPAAAARLPAGLRSRHQRQPRRAAGPELCASQAPAALARQPGPRQRLDRVAERCPADQDAIGGEEPGARGRVRGRAPLRG